MEITANAVQTVAVHQNVLFTDLVVSGNCSVVHREGSGIVKLRGLTATQKRARFRASFNANIAIPSEGNVGPISIALAIDGEPLPVTKMIVTPAATEEFFNVAADTFIEVPAGCCSTFEVINTSDTAVSVQNANLIIERVA